MTKKVADQKAQDLAVIVNSGGAEGLSDEQFKARYGQTVAQASKPAKKDE